MNSSFREVTKRDSQRINRELDIPAEALSSGSVMKSDHY